LSPSEHSSITLQKVATTSDLLFGVGVPLVKTKTHNKFCLKCRKEFLSKREAQKYCCSECANSRQHTVWPTPEELKELVWSIPTTEIAVQLGVSDGAVAKHVKKLGLSKPGRGYWS